LNKETDKSSLVMYQDFIFWVYCMFLHMGLWISGKAISTVPLVEDLCKTRAIADYDEYTCYPCFVTGNIEIQDISEFQKGAGNLW